MNKKQKTSLAGAALLFILALSFSAAAFAGPIIYVVHCRGFKPVTVKHCALEVCTEVTTGKDIYLPPHRCIWEKK